MIILNRTIKIFTHQKSRLYKKGIKYIYALFFNIIAIAIINYFAKQFWPTFIQNYIGQQWKIFSVIVPATSILTSLVCHFIYYIIQQFDLFQDYMITKDPAKLPWKTNKQAWYKLRNKSIKLMILNLGVIGLIFSIYDSFKTKISFSPQIPSVSQQVCHLYFCMFFQSILFFLVHWLGHAKLYSLHKVHHQFNFTHPLATTHFHPIDYIIGVIIPFGLGIRLLGHRMHFITLLLWAIYRGGQGIDGHSNYEFPWSPFRVIPLSASSQYHSYHHTHNVGNFGSFFQFEDTLFGQNEAYYDYVEKKQKKN